MIAPRIRGFYGGGGAGREVGAKKSVIELAKLSFERIAENPPGPSAVAVLLTT